MFGCSLNVGKVTVMLEIPVLNVCVQKLTVSVISNTDRVHYGTSLSAVVTIVSHKVMDQPVTRRILSKVEVMYLLLKKCLVSEDPGSNRKYASSFFQSSIWCVRSWSHILR